MESFYPHQIQREEDVHRLIELKVRELGTSTDLTQQITEVTSRLMDEDLLGLAAVMEIFVDAHETFLSVLRRDGTEPKVTDDMEDRVAELCDRLVTMHGEKISRSLDDAAPVIGAILAQGNLREAIWGGPHDDVWQAVLAPLVDEVASAGELLRRRGFTTDEVSLYVLCSSI